MSTLLYTHLDLQSKNLQKNRLKSWERFLEIGLPESKDAFQYVKLRKLYQLELNAPQDTLCDPSPWVYPECENSYLVFNNGFFKPELSKIPDELTVMTIDEASLQYGTLLNNQTVRSIKEEKDPFVLLNQAFYQNGIFIYVEPKSKLPPLQIVSLVDGQNSFVSPRVQLFMGQLSELPLLMRHVSVKGQGSFCNLAVEATLEEGARLSYTQVLLESSDMWVFDAFRAIQKRDSDVKTYAATSGSETIRTDYSIALVGENGQCHLNGLWMLNESLEAHTHVFMDHRAPNCESRQLYKGALDNSSRSSFEGKIFVRQEAQKTNSFQLNNNLLLSDTAYACSKPNLEIFADDVKASHGSTVGQLDPEELFYLETRGFDKALAKTLLTNAFLQEVIMQMELSSVREQVTEASHSFLKEKAMIDCKVAL
jgi:Fe-S cluster assembly protein SufD